VDYLASGGKKQKSTGEFEENAKQDAKRRGRTEGVESERALISREGTYQSHLTIPRRREKGIEKNAQHLLQKEEKGEKRTVVRKN